MYNVSNNNYINSFIKEIYSCYHRETTTYFFGRTITNYYY